ncbi:toll/interleukin-1 receptor domain-containing protein [Parasphingorhabdus sp.]|uniref:toll/interleukin-1 receptor domain-containing protein n=1 Tax=Parasphingorhabdus sp. TaxID=2709688 RepID=UPI003263C87C
MESGSSAHDEIFADRFRAFVSYSHADAKVARRLHRKIENYRLPARITDGLETAGGGLASRRLGKIFRDREDLPAAQDLSEAVKDALSRSEALIVLCSPDAQASPWVAQEISLFRSLHPERPVLAALVRGEPEEAFPAALSEGAEPLAADLRKEGDGWRLGFLKIVAGIAGVPLDALVQRDATRRIRRVMAVTGGALIALLAMIGMTVFALQSRNEAQHQQAEAEGLVEYMLTDLRTELKGVGRLDVMTKVNERAMDYYEDQGDLSEMPAESLERRARILHAMGEDDEKRGGLHRALEKFSEAHRVTEALLQRDPENPDRVFGHAQSEYWVGYIAYLLKDWGTTEIHWQQYKLLADQLIKKDSANLGWLREAGYADGNLCTLALQREDKRTNPIETCMSALKSIEQVSEGYSNDTQSQIDLANRFAFMGDAFGAIGQSTKATVWYRRQDDLLSKVLKQEPKNMTVLDALTRSKMTLSEALEKNGQFKEAQNLNRQALSLAYQIVSKDPDNKRWDIWLSRIKELENKLHK